MRGHESNEAYRAGREHRERGQRGGDHKHHRPRDARIETENGAAQLAGGEHVEGASADQ